MQKKKSTDELEEILRGTHPAKASQFLKQEEESFLDEKAFSSYMRMLIKKKNLQQQEIFLMADIPERYGYKLISEEKHTRQRDVILRLCYAAHFTLDETQQALRIYGMPELYARFERDALLMIAFNERPGSIIEVNAFLKSHNMPPLRTTGVQE